MNGDDFTPFIQHVWVNPRVRTLPVDQSLVYAFLNVVTKAKRASFYIGKIHGECKEFTVAGDVRTVSDGESPELRRIDIIDYGNEQPTLSAKVQEFYGVTAHPVVGRKRIPLRIELLSPALRPVQVTTDLPGFWRGSWELVRKEMKSRYPKHLWPEDPASEKPTLRSVKPKNT